MELVFGKSQERFESELIVNQAITNKQVVRFNFFFAKFSEILYNSLDEFLGNCL